MTKKIQHSGSCHCGKVDFEVTAPAVINAVKCNCSICSKSGYLHLIVSAEDFELLSGNNSLTNYQFNSKIAHHLFCNQCGVKSFYIPRSHPSGYSINVNCLDPETISSISIEDFDGKHWEDSISSLLS